MSTSTKRKKMQPSYNAEELKADIRLICDANPQPIKFIIGFAKPGKKKETYSTRADFGRRLLDLIANARTNNISFFNYKTVGYMNNLGSPVQNGKSSKNLEFVEITVQTKADAAVAFLESKRAASAHRFDSKYQGD